MPTIGGGNPPVAFEQLPNSPIKVWTSVLTEAQLKAALTGIGQSIEVMPAQGAGTIIEVVHLIASCNFTAAPAGGATLDLRWGTAFIGVIDNFSQFYAGGLTGSRGCSMVPATFNFVPSQWAQVTNVGLRWFLNSGAIPVASTMSASGLRTEITYRVHVSA